MTRDGAPGAQRQRSVRPVRPVHGHSATEHKLQRMTHPDSNTIYARTLARDRLAPVLHRPQHSAQLALHPST